MYSMVKTAIVCGIGSVEVLVEADVSDGMPVFHMVGFLGAEVKEAGERVRTALRNSGYILPAKRITVNLSPADLRKSGSGFDLPIALALLAALGVIPEDALEGLLVLGEIALNGNIQPVNGVLPMIADAAGRGITKCIVAAKNAPEAELVSGMTVYGVEELAEVIALLNGKKTMEQEKKRLHTGPAQKKTTGGDFADVNGQGFLKRACEVAVSGMHNLLMVGPPGSGKSMLAGRIPTILPDMTFEEQMEVSKIYSVSGLLNHDSGLIGVRPFRSPHHTITPQALAGGGRYPKPGEISLAHNGVLFLDELTEFKKETLEILRQPLEEKQVRLVRLGGTYTYPADFLLIGAMNPCNCGYYPDMNRCRCSVSSLERYREKLSQPLLDRMDLCVEAASLGYDELTGQEHGETSAVIRARVNAVHQIQRERFRGTNIRYNSQIPASLLEKYCSLDRMQRQYMKEVYEQLQLTARTYHKLLKVARTLADMDGSVTIRMEHLNEAVCYRSLDKKFWERM